VSSSESLLPTTATPASFDNWVDAITGEVSGLLAGGAVGGWTFFREELFPNTTAAVFGGIPTGLTRLRIEVEYACGNGANQYGFLRFNGDGTTGNYQYNRLEANLSETTTTGTSLILTTSWQNALCSNHHIIKVSRRPGIAASFLGEGRYHSPLAAYRIGGRWMNTTDDITSFTLHAHDLAHITPRIAVWGR
jgi:hypothetical protein